MYSALDVSAIIEQSVNDHREYGEQEKTSVAAKAATLEILNSPKLLSESDGSLFST